MANVLIGVTGSVAAIRTERLCHELIHRRHHVQVVATRAAVYFFDPRSIESVTVTLDDDEWPGREQGRRYQRGDEVRHIELRRWADLLLIAPLDANTLAKMAAGICDNCLSCVWRAWDPARPVVVAPAMNTLMWEHPATQRHLRSVALDFSGGPLPDHLDQDQIIPAINDACRSFHIVAPVTKQLACGDVGAGAMAEVEAIADAVDRIIGRFAT
jgi:phosphopantothenoylcysteine decarboxylase